MTPSEELLDDLALSRLSRPASLPGGLDRRRFLQLMGAGAGAAAMASPLLNALEAFAAPPVAANEGILVLIMLEGGNDGLNTVVPTGESRYYQLRPGLAIPAASALPIGTGVGLHPSFTKLKARFDQGDVAVVQGVGYPNPDLSHFSSMGIWMNGWAGGAQPGGPTGWIGRFLDGLPNAAAESLYGAVIGTSVPLHMVGAVARASGLPENIGGAFGIDRRDPNDVRMFDAMGAFAGGATGLGQWGDLAAKVEHDTLDLSQKIQPAYAGTFPDTNLGRQMVLTARLINANLGVRVFSTSIGGFDTHSDQATGHALNLAEIDGAIDAFFAAFEQHVAQPRHDHDVLGVRSPAGAERHRRHRPRDGRAAVRRGLACEGRPLRRAVADDEPRRQRQPEVPHRLPPGVRDRARHVARRRLPAGARLHVPQPRSLRRWARRRHRDLGPAAPAAPAPHHDLIRLHFSPILRGLTPALGDK